MRREVVGRICGYGGKDKGTSRVGPFLVKKEVILAGETLGVQGIPAEMILKKGRISAI